jgi:AcrR family transcriptional regulator
MEARVHEAALAVYRDRGWSGFSFDVVAKTAGVGKNALYLRWASREDLLVAALEQLIVEVPELDRGSVREDLHFLVASMAATFTGPAGLAPLRVLLEAHSAPELFNRFAEVASSRVIAARTAIARGVARGELPADTDVVVLADLLGGAVINQALIAPFDAAGSALSDPGAFADRVLDAVLPSPKRRRTALSANRLTRSDQREN